MLKRFTPARPAAAWSLLALLALAGLGLTGCERKPSPESRRIEQLEFRLQQLETRLNQVSARQGQPAGRGDRLPAGPVKSLTYRRTDAGIRLRIYWADGSTSDLECTQEQSTLACG
ncbi:MAG: hypothetical protein VKJ44_03730 [Synechococcus sp.]|nr:hypothetical protein [Synechococcus sp.]